MAVAPIKSSVQSHRDLLVWQRGMELTELCYKFTAHLPKEETYGLTAQLRRCVVSIPSNIAEGFGRDSTGSFIQHLRIAQGSLKEFETQVMICHRVGLCNADLTVPLLSKGDELGKMLRSLIRSLQPSSNE
jgi:four helix bundle protein